MVVDAAKLQGGELVRTGSSDEAREAREKERFDSFHDSVLFGVGNLEGVTTIKIGYGDVRVGGLGVVDGAYDLAERTIGVCVQSASKSWLDDPTSFILRLLQGVAMEIARGTLDEAVVAFDRDCDDEAEFQSFLDDLKLLVKEEVAAKLSIASGSADHVIKQIAMTLTARPAA